MQLNKDMNPIRLKLENGNIWQFHLMELQAVYM